MRTIVFTSGLNWTSLLIISGKKIIYFKNLMRITFSIHFMLGKNSSYSWDITFDRLTAQLEWTAGKNFRNRVTPFMFKGLFFTIIYLVSSQRWKYIGTEYGPVHKQIPVIWNWKIIRCLRVSHLHTLHKKKS